MSEYEYILDDNKRQITENNWGFIIWYANNWYNRNPKEYLEIDDVTQLCALAFIKSLKTYNPEKSKITSWSSLWMDSVLQRHAGYVSTKQYINEYNSKLKITDNDENHEYDYIQGITHIYYPENIDRFINDYSIIQIVNNIKHLFTERQFEFIEYYVSHPNMTQADISKVFGVSRERIRQIISKFHSVTAEYCNKEELIA